MATKKVKRDRRTGLRTSTRSQPRQATVANGIRASAAPESEHDGMRQGSTFGTERRVGAHA